MILNVYNMTIQSRAYNIPKLLNHRAQHVTSVLSMILKAHFNTCLCVAHIITFQSLPALRFEGEAHLLFNGL